MEPRAEFKRMVLGLPHSARDYVSVTYIVEFADLLGLDLIGIFAEDEQLIDLALLPCVREFRLSGDGWHRLDLEQLTRDTNQAAADARRLFADAAKTLRGTVQFDLVKGQVGEAIELQSMPENIIVVIEPKNPADRVTYQFRHLMETALNAPAATLLVPSRISRNSGPVVAIATNGRDVSIQVGLRVAEAVGEKLIVFAPNVAAEALSTRAPSASAVHVDRRPLPVAEVGLAELESILGTAGERLLVMSRGLDHLFPSRLASERGVPVLVTARGESSRSVD
jgi:hypothetical protein